MLKDSKLGAALTVAMKAKGVTQKKVAVEFGITQPSVSEWTRLGRIDKAHINHLVAYFSDVVRPSHWGLPDDWGAMPEASPEPQMNPEAIKVAEQFQRLSNPEQRKTILALLSLYQPISGVESAAADAAAREPRPSPPPALPPPDGKPRAKPSAKRAR